MKKIDFLNGEKAKLHQTRRKELFNDKIQPYLLGEKCYMYIYRNVIVFSSSFDHVISGILKQDNISMSF